MSPRGLTDAEMAALEKQQPRGLTDEQMAALEAPNTIQGTEGDEITNPAVDPGFADVVSGGSTEIAPGVNRVWGDRTAQPVQKPGPVEALGRGLQNGVSLGLAPVVQSYLSSKLGGPEFSQGLAAERQRNEAAGEARPVAYYGGTVFGGAGAPVPNVVRLAPGASLGARIGAGAVNGAVGGGVAGAVGGAAEGQGVLAQDTGGVARDALRGGLQGARLGGALGAAIPAGGAVGRYIGGKLHEAGDVMATKALGLIGSNRRDLAEQGMLQPLLHELETKDIISPLGTAESNVRRLEAAGQVAGEDVGNAVTDIANKGGKFDAQALEQRLLASRDVMANSGASKAALARVDNAIDEIHRINLSSPGGASPELAFTKKKDWQSVANYDPTATKPEQRVMRGLAGEARQSLLESAPSSETVNNLSRALKTDQPYQAAVPMARGRAEMMHGHSALGMLGGQILGGTLAGTLAGGGEHRGAGAGYGTLSGLALAALQKPGRQIATSAGTRAAWGLGHALEGGGINAINGTGLAGQLANPARTAVVGDYIQNMLTGPKSGGNKDPMQP